MLTRTFYFIIIIVSVQSYQAFSISEKSNTLLPDGKSSSVQDSIKYQYIGIEKCASICHNNGEMGYQYDIMKSGPHSKAFQILTSEKALYYAKNGNVKEKPQESAVCLKCHVTGGGLDSSYFALTYKKDDGITCEACHKREFITKSFLPKETDCLKCHNNSVHNISRFEFNDKCAKIAHPRPKV
jgi:hypothetical protein